MTQNVDDLHEQAGSEPVVHMHGERLSRLCSSCLKDWRGEPWWQQHDACPDCGGRLRPPIVWFGEVPHALPRVYQALENCRIFVSIGTSGNTYPAAGFVATAREVGAHCLELNVEPSRGAVEFDDGGYGPATEIVPRWVEEVLGGR